MRGIGVLVGSFLAQAALGWGSAAQAATSEAEKGPDPKAQAKAVYNEAVRVNDLWTALQLEAWAASQKVQLRGGPVLGASDIVGNPLMACPDDIYGVIDRGDALWVLTANRYYVYAPDGRPLAPAIQFGFRADKGDVAFDGGYVAGCGLEWRDSAPKRFWTTVRATSDGRVVMEGLQDLDEPEGTYFGPANPQDASRCAVANDGTAVAVCCSISDKERDHHHVSVVVAGKRRIYDELRSPIGVGSLNAWMIAWTSNPGEDPYQVLAIGDERIRLKAAACGPGIAAVITADNVLQLIDKTGKRLPFPLPLSIGDNPRMATLGRCLVVGSGDNAKELDNTDLLGVEIQMPPQPNTMTVFSWDDLSGKKPAALGSYAGRLEIAYHQTAAAYLWHDKEVELLDLSGRKPTTHPFFTAQQAVDHVEANKLWTLVRTTSGSKTLVDESGHDLWTGEGYVQVMNASWAVISNGRRNTIYDLVRLSPDPKERSSTRLALDGPEYYCAADPYSDRMLAKGNGHWQLMDLAGPTLGKVLGQGLTKNWSPAAGFVTTPGRYLAHVGRLYPKAQVEVPAEADRLTPKDAWQCGRVEMVLTYDERVLMVGMQRKPDYKQVGDCPGGDSFGTCAKDELVINSWNNNGRMRVLGSIISNREPFKPEVDAKRDGLDAPAGPWQVAFRNNKFEFVPPHMGGTLVWSDETAHFSPKRVRSPKGNDPPFLVLVTESLVINLDPALAKQVAKK